MNFETLFLGGIILFVICFFIFLGWVALGQHRRDKIEDDRRKLKENQRRRIEQERATTP